MALKVRVTATHGQRVRGPVPPLVYRAEAYEEGDGFREPKWCCKHDHQLVEQALQCGHEWMEQGAQLESA